MRRTSTRLSILWAEEFLPDLRSCPMHDPEKKANTISATDSRFTFDSTRGEQGDTMPTDFKRQVVELLKSLETSDRSPLATINPNKYIQHNLRVADGLAGFRERLESLPKGGAKVNTVRVFQDGNFVFTHTEYNIGGPRIGFDIFRLEEGKIVEHWDNLQQTAAEPSPSGHTMTEGPTVASDFDKTEFNKTLMQAYMDDLLNGRRDRFRSYFEGNNYIQHNALVGDGLSGLIAGLRSLTEKGLAVKYEFTECWGKVISCS
jgi:predicted SnoaL-like aldol condensation-catalyzing enzyme